MYYPSFDRRAGLRVRAGELTIWDRRLVFPLIPAINTLFKSENSEPPDLFLRNLALLSSAPSTPFVKITAKASLARNLERHRGSPAPWQNRKA